MANNQYRFYDPQANVWRSIIGNAHYSVSVGYCLGGYGLRIDLDYREVYRGCWDESTFTISPAGVDPDQKYDCLNGGCIPKTTYNTPGAFPSLATCQSGCAKNSNCTGECVSPEELAALQQAANTLQSKFCK
jgi:hypothetical protein